jgi:hypothetical protein
MVSEQVREELGGLDSDEIYERWNKWATEAAKRGLQEEQ